MPKSCLCAMTRLFTTLAQMDKEMPASRMQMLLLVAQSDGILVKELCERTGLMNQSTVARAVSLLGERKSRGMHAPLGWVETRPDPAEPRRVLVYLTPKGKRFLLNLEELLE